ncbi:MAG TPA: hypothetical protein VGA85_04480 [Dehalococcoidales bacterium]
MKHISLYCILAMIFISLTVAGCSTTNVEQSKLEFEITGVIPPGYHRMTIQEIEQMIGIPLPVPGYLPYGLKIEEVYAYQIPNTIPTQTAVLILISDVPVARRDSQYTCQLALEIGWNEAGLGLKMIDAELIPEIEGRLQKNDDQLILWWESYGSPDSLGSTLRLHADLKFLLDEMVGIASSTPSLATQSP